MIASRLHKVFRKLLDLKANPRNAGTGQRCFLRVRAYHWLLCDARLLSRLLCRDC